MIARNARAALAIGLVVTTGLWAVAAFRRSPGRTPSSAHPAGVLASDASSDHVAPSDLQPLRQPAEAESAVGASLAPGAQPPAGTDVLANAETCLRPDLGDLDFQAADFAPVWRCLESLDWKRVAPTELATWLCGKRRPIKQACLVIGAALHARPASEGLRFLAEYKPTCLEVRETGLQIMAIEAIGRVDPAWVAQLERSFSPEALFTGDSSGQGILLAEYFIRRGNARIAALLRAGGRGEFGGSEWEIDRAARTGMFVSSSDQWDSNRSENAWAYADSLLKSPTSPAAIGGVLAAFLPSKQAWPGGDSTPALTTLLSAMDVPKFKLQAALVLFNSPHWPKGPDGCNQELWDQIYEQVLAMAAEGGWQHH